MDANVRVRLQPTKYPRGTDFEVVVPLSEALIYQAMEQLDIPDCDAPEWGQMLCTSDYKIQLVMVEREKCARVIADAVARALVNAMSANDTKMGYKIKG